MEISYKRETNHNYLVVKPENEQFGYEARMLAGNDIRGLLRMRVKFSDGSPLYYYDITSKQPLNRLLESRSITRDEICQILIQINVALACMEEYMLGDGGILLEPENIYVEPGLFQPFFCLVPGQKGDFQEKLNRLFQYILKRVDHRDRECVVLTYGLYQESLKENYGMDDLLRLISPQEEKIEVDTRNEPMEQYGEEDKGQIGPEYGLKDPEPPGKTFIDSALIRMAGIWLFIVMIGPSALWLFKGKNIVFGLRYFFAAADTVILIVLLAIHILMRMDKDKHGDKSDIKDKNKKEKQEPEEDMWQILYTDDEEEAGPVPGAPGPNRDKPNFTHPLNENTGTESLSYEFSHETEAVCQTALLSERADESCVHRLVSKNRDGEDIMIPYYPFVIGKHKDLADHVLLRDTVSRFHLRIDEHDGEYMVTDLNSTNGTKIRGRILDSNETVKIESGDSVFIADLEFIFT